MVENRSVAKLDESLSDLMVEPLPVTEVHHGKPEGTQEREDRLR